MYVFVPGPTILNQARKSLEAILKTSSSCRTTHDQDLTLDRRLGIEQQSAFEAEEPGPRHTEKIVTILKLAEGFEGTEDVIKVVKDIDSNEQRGATTRQRVMRMRVFCREILQQKRSFSRHASVFDFKSSSEIHTSLPLLLGTGSDDSNDSPAVQEEVRPP
jgi:hypothetical protein